MSLFYIRHPYFSYSGQANKQANAAARPCQVSACEAEHLEQQSQHHLLPTETIRRVRQNHLLERRLF